MTVWRNLGGLLAACVLALLVVAPMAGMAACVCEDGPGVIGATSLEPGASIAQAAPSDGQEHGAPCDAACCVGGHCHHGGAMLDAVVAGGPAPAPVVAAHAASPSHALASRALSGPDRPPRA